MQNKCIDCGELLRDKQGRTKRCYPCAAKARAKDPQWIESIKKMTQNINWRKRITIKSEAWYIAHHEGIKKWIQSPEGRIKRRLAVIKRSQNLNWIKALSGKNCHLYIHGQGRKLYGNDFTLLLRRQIRDQDKHVCQICGIKENGRKLDIHHIDYDKNNNHPNNLIALCISCHGRTRANRNYWQFYFKLENQHANPLE